MLELPPDPAVLRAEQPTLYGAAFGDETPAFCKVPLVQIMAIDSSFPCRGFFVMRM